MFKNTFQSGFLSILYSIGCVCATRPVPVKTLSLIMPVYFCQLQEQAATDLGQTGSQWPHQAYHGPGHPVVGAGDHGYERQHQLHHVPGATGQDAGHQVAVLVMIIKNLKKYFTFEVQVLDDKNVRRRFRASNYQSSTRVKPFICTMPMRLDEGWNQIQFNLSDFTRRAYGTNYIETLRVQIHANCRIRRIYFSDRLYSEEELPPEFKLFLPVPKANNTTSNEQQKAATPAEQFM
ncbi:Cilia/flagella-associated protein 20/WDR90/C3orf67 [Phytophthora cactorum]|nr:Cilia/flagella-associated protein 20/WDR90/C3orf67 [Phytophthora cactorum]